MSEDRDVRANLGVTSDSGEMKEIAGDIRTIGDALLEVSDATKQATLDFESFGAARLTNASSLDVPVGLDVPGGGRGGAGQGKGGKGKRGGGRAGVAALTQASSLLGEESGAAAGQVLGLASEAARAAEGITSLVGGMGPLGIVAGGVVVAGTIAATIALGEYAEQSKANAEQVQREIDATRSLAEAKNQTSEEIKNELALLEEQIGVEQEVAAETERYNDALKAGADEIRSSIGPFFDLGKSLNFWGTEVDVASDNLKEQNQTVKDLAAEHKALTEALESEEVAANDAAVAEEERAEALEKQRDDDLAKAAEEATESQNELAQAEANLASEAEAAAKAVQAASKKTAKAREDEKAARKEFREASKESKADLLKLEEEQAQELEQLKISEFKAELKAREGFGDSLDELLDNQSFLQAIKKQNSFVKEEKDRKAANRQALIDLQMDLAEEKIIEEIAAQEMLAEKKGNIAKETALVREAKRDELRLKNESSRDMLELQRTVAEQEMKLRRQVDDNTITMLTRVVEFSEDAVTAVNNRLASVDTGGGRKKKGRANSIAGIQEMMQEVFRP